jgi:hypothetical protein
MSQLDALLPDDHPASRAFRRLLVIELRKRSMVRGGVVLRIRRNRGRGRSR